LSRLVRPPAWKQSSLFYSSLGPTQGEIFEDITGTKHKWQTPATHKQSCTYSAYTSVCHVDVTRAYDGIRSWRQR